MNLTDFIGVGGVSAAAGTLAAGTLALLLLILVWSFVWKGLALWKAARKGSPIWFIVMLIVNTLGILEILYIFVFSKMGQKTTETKKKKRR